MAVESPVFRLVAVLVGFCGVLASGCSDTDERGPHIGTAGFHMSVELGDRSYDLYAPEAYDGSAPVPAVLVLHGMPGGPADAQYSSGMDDLAEEEGFLAVYPAGTGGRWSATPGGGDVDYIRDLVDDLVSAWNADPERIYVSGFSNGADMAMVVGVELADRVAAVAQVAPSGTGQVRRAIDSMEEPVPVVAFLGGGDHRLDIGAHLLEDWRARADCGEEQTTEDDGLTTSTWECGDDTEMAAHVLDGQGHVWFGDSNRREPLWASEAMWEFFTNNPS